MHVHGVVTIVVLTSTYDAARYWLDRHTVATNRLRLLGHNPGVTFQCVTLATGHDRLRGYRYQGMIKSDTWDSIPPSTRKRNIEEIAQICCTG